MTGKFLRTVVDYNARAVAKAACPQCGAEIGEPCRGATGHPVKYTHHTRRRTARREVARLRAMT